MLRVVFVLRSTEVYPALLRFVERCLRSERCYCSSLTIPGRVFTLRATRACHIFDVFKSSFFYICHYCHRHHCRHRHPYHHRHRYHHRHHRGGAEGWSEQQPTTKHQQTQQKTKKNKNRKKKQKQKQKRQSIQFGKLL